MDASNLDRLDPLAPFRDRFVISEPEVAYLDGNSLGRMPLQAAESLKDAINRQWGDRLIRSWGEGWYGLPQRVGAKIGELLGTQPGEVICCDSTSVNFYKLVHSVLSNRPAGRTKIVTDNLNFPSDVYLLQGLAKQFPGVEVVVVESMDGIHIWPEQIQAVLDEQTALLTLSHCCYRSGFLHDMRSLTEDAHSFGIPVLWDLSHSAGAVEIDLAQCNVDYAVGCTYKYLNGGPGSPAYLYVRKELQAEASNPIWGWFGQNRPFEFSLAYEPAAGLDRMMTGTPPVLSMIAVEAGVDLLLEAGMERVAEKSRAMFSFLLERWKENLADLGVGLGSPVLDGRHGSHALLTHPNAYAIDQALIQKHKVIPDFRAPDGVRFGFAPLYTTFSEIERAVGSLRRVLETGEWREFEGEVGGVT